MDVNITCFSPLIDNCYIPAHNSTPEFFHSAPARIWNTIFSGVLGISGRRCKVFQNFAQIFTLLLPEFREKAMANSGKSNGNFGQKQWENLGKSNEKTRKAAAYFGQKLLLLPEFPITFPLISHCFCPFYSFFPYFPLLLPEFPIAFARRISHCFCPNFSFSKLLGGTVPTPPASYAYASTHGPTMLHQLKKLRRRASRPVFLILHDIWCKIQDLRFLLHNVSPSLRMHHRPILLNNCFFQFNFYVGIMICKV